MRLIFSFVLCCQLLGARSYSTTFPGEENPISQGNIWLNGGTDGVDWCNVRIAWGSALGVGSCPTKYADPTAILKGDWGPDQTLRARARVVSRDSHYYQEIELRLRTTLTPHKIVGYEINFGVSHAYLQIVRWNGRLADFTYLGKTCNYPTVCGQVNGFTIANGDVAVATIQSGVIRVYVNGGLIAQATDYTYKTGNPGLGFDYGCDGTYSLFGWSSFFATDDASSVP